ncbi:hypothetical protein AAEP93_008656 [Penicillium crustosum]
MFSSIYDAKEHADEHYAKSRHVQRGHFKKGECEPLEVLKSLSGENIKAEGQPLPTVEAAGDEYRGNESEDEAEYSDDEEDGDGEDPERESDDEAEESKDGEPTVEQGQAYKILLLQAPLLIPVLELPNLKACTTSASSAQGREESLTD